MSAEHDISLLEQSNLDISVVTGMIEIAHSSEIHQTATFAISLEQARRESSAHGH